MINGSKSLLARFFDFLSCKEIRSKSWYDKGPDLSVLRERFQPEFKPVGLYLSKKWDYQGDRGFILDYRTSVISWISRYGCAAYVHHNPKERGAYFVKLEAKLHVLLPAIAGAWLSTLMVPLFI